MGSGPRREQLSARNDTYQVLESLKTNRRARSKRNLIFVEGVAPINAAVASGVAAEIVVVPAARRLSGWANDTITRLRAKRLIEVDEPLFAELSDRGTPSELLAILDRPDVRLEEITVDAGSVVVILDRPSNHGNLGSIVRTSDAFGVRAVITTGHCVDHFDPAVIRASLGAVFTTPVVHEPSTVALQEWIAARKRARPGVAVIGTDSKGPVSLAGAQITRPTVVMFGNEATGLSPALREIASAIVSIPIPGHVDSLNLACAAGIVLYSLCTHVAGRE